VLVVLGLIIALLYQSRSRTDFVDRRLEGFTDVEKEQIETIREEGIESEGSIETLGEFDLEQAMSLCDRELVADAITFSGVVKGVTRMGIISHKSSIFARAAFETPDKQFVNATIQGKKDELASVIENIILNQPVPVGTGLPGLLVEVTGPLVNKELDKKKKVKK